MDNRIRVLVFPAGEINSMELHDALSSNVNVQVFGASSIDRHGPYVFKQYYSGLPMTSSPDFENVFENLLKKLKIDILFPTHDSVALYFSENRKKFSAKIMVPDIHTARICRDKRETYCLFSDLDFCPRYDQSPQIFPCFIKPRKGQGAQGARLLRSPEQIPPNIVWDEYVTTEYLPGQELTVDCLTEARGGVRAVLPRTRDRVMAGISVAGTALEATKEIRNIAEQINERLHFLGLWYFQVKQDVWGRYKLLEVSARCAGTMCLSRARGVNLPLLSVYAAMGQELTIFENSCTVKVDRTLISRYQLNYYYENIYVDYDDTIIINDEVCLPMIRFLYQCRNMGKKITLLTRHEMDHSTSIKEDLAHFAISTMLFQDIISLKSGEEKWEYITTESAIFIDNAFSERKAVYERLHIPVFDVEGVEVLTDWRC